MSTKPYEDREGRSEAHKNSIESLKNFLDSPEGKAHMDEYWGGIIAEQKRLAEFFETPEFEARYQQLLKETAEGFIQTTDYPGEEASPTVTDDQLMEFESSLREVQKADNPAVQEVTVLPLCYFASSAVKYKELIFETICGQGCFTRVHRAMADNHRPADLAEVFDNRKITVTELIKRQRESE